MTDISTHVLDLARGVAAEGISVTLERADTAGSFSRVGRATTDADGRIRTFGPNGTDSGAGRYRLTFLVDEYFAALGVESFFPEVQLLFVVQDGAQPQHVPLLLSPFGYSTYRGS